MVTIIRGRGVYVCVCVLSQAEEASKRLEQESARFARDTELLRGQLAQLQASIATSLTQRSQRTAADGKARDQAKTEADREALQKVGAWGRAVTSYYTGPVCMDLHA